MTVRQLKVLGTCLVCVVSLCLVPAAVMQCPASPGDATDTIIHRDRSGTYKSGKWSYTCTITRPGSRSEGAMGQLLYDGTPLPPPDRTEDYYETPLGRFYHVGMPVVPWGEHGWMPADPRVAAGTGTPLPVPGTAATAGARAVQQMKLLLKTMTAGGARSPYLREPLQDDYLAATDPWGTRYRIFQDLRGGEGGGEVARLELTSAGADGHFDTADDIVRASPFISIAGPGNASDLRPEAPESAETPEIEEPMKP